MSFNQLGPVHWISAASLSATYTSPAQYVKGQDNVGIQLNWTGTPTGSFTVQISNDYNQDLNGNILAAGNWVTLTLSASISAAGSADTAYISLNQLPAFWIRIVYTRVSGTGALDGYLTGKGV